MLEVNRKLSATARDAMYNMYTDPERLSAQRYRWTDRRGQTDDIMMPIAVHRIVYSTVG